MKEKIPIIIFLHKPVQADPTRFMELDNLAKTFSHLESRHQAEFFNIVGKEFKNFTGFLGCNGQANFIVNGAGEDDPSVLDKDGKDFLTMLFDATNNKGDK